MKKIIALIAVVAVLFSGVLGFVVIKSGINFSDSTKIKLNKIGCHILGRSEDCRNYKRATYQYKPSNYKLNKEDFDLELLK